MSYRYKLIDTHAPRYPAGKFSSLPYALRELEKCYPADRFKLIDRETGLEVKLTD